MTKKRFDIVVFGASGFVGQFVVEEIARMLIRKDVEPFTWAVAGRSKGKLLRVLQNASKITGNDVTGTQILEVDVEAPETLHAMAKVATVVANCVGPYQLLGEQVVKACIAEGAHHLDISAEPQFSEKVQLLYHKEAEAKKVYIIGSCGYDSIPSDIGMVFMKQKFNGELNSVQMCMEFGNGAVKKVTHHGTWASALHVVANLKELRPIRAKLFTTPLPEPKYPLKKQKFLHYNKEMKAWCIPFVGTDKGVADRSERYFYEKENQRPVQFNPYHKMDYLFQAVMFLFGLLYLSLMAQFKFTRDLLINWPRVFTLGFCDTRGPTREQANFPFTCTLVGSGWKEPAGPVDKEATPPNKKITVKVRGRNPGYGATCICLISSALTVLKESSKMPSTGGVYTTAAAFSKTDIISRLQQNGLSFEVVDEN